MSCLSTAKKTHHFAVGKHVSGHGIHHGVSIARRGMHLRYVERIKPEYIAMFAQRRTGRRVGGAGGRITADLYFLLCQLNGRDCAFDLAHALRNIKQKPMREVPKPQSRRWAVPIRHDEHERLGLVRHTFPRHFGRHTLALAGIRGWYVTARDKTDAMQNDCLRECRVIRSIDIASARGTHICERDEGRRQHENREDYFAEELHVDSIAKKNWCARRDYSA